MVKKKIQKAKKLEKEMKCSVEKPSRRNFLIIAAAAAAGLIALAGFGFHEPLIPAAEYTTSPDGLIYVSKPASVIHDRSLVEKIRDIIWKEQISKDSRYHSVQIFNFKTLEACHYIIPLESGSQFPEYRMPLIAVKEDLKSYGLDRAYFLNPVYAVSDIKEGLNIVNIVAQTGDDLEGKIELLWPDESTENLNFRARQPGYGHQSTDTSKQSGKIVREKTLIFVGLSNDLLLVYDALYAEILHAEVALTLRHMIESMRQSSDFAEAKAAMEITNESIVHGLLHSWLNDNYARYGFDEKSVHEHIVHRESSHRYKGASVIRNLAGNMGRAEVFKDFCRTPLKYWKMIRQSIPEYQKIFDVRQDGDIKHPIPSHP